MNLRTKIQTMMNEAENPQFAVTGGLHIGYGVAAFLGTAVSISMGMIILLLAAAAWATDTGLMLFGVPVFGVLCLCGIIAAVSGFRGTRLVRRFEQYRALLADTSVMNIADIAHGMQRTPQDVLRDIRKFIEKRWLKQGHLVEHDTALVLTDAAWNEYIALEQRRRAAAAHSAADAKTAGSAAASDTADGLPEAARAVYEASRAHLDYMREKKPCIHSAQTAREAAELIGTAEKILGRLLEYPACAAQLDTFAHYFLPSARKLFDNYIQIEDDSGASGTAAKTLDEITQALCTLSGAFERLLDSLYHDTALDVSSDIAVLNTVLAREGLSGRQINMP